MDCERPPPTLTLGSFLDAHIATKSVAEEYDEAATESNTEVAGAVTSDVQGDTGPKFTIRKNKKGTLPISYENRSKGKKVTVISNVSGDASALVSELKRLTGTGGVQKGESIELQGDRRDFLAKFLKGHSCVVQR